MRVLVATNAWHPQVNGVVRTLSSLQESVAVLGGEIVCLSSIEPRRAMRRVRRGWA